MNERTDRLLAWSACGLTLWYVAWTGYALANRVATHAKLFSALGAQLPWPTQVVLALSRPLFVWPVCCALLAFLVAKELLIQSSRTKLLLSVIVFMLTASVAAVVGELLFLPMSDLINKIG